MPNIRGCIKTLEKLSLITCSNEVLPLLERALDNVQPILELKTEGAEPLLWQNEITIDRLNRDQVNVKLSVKDIKKNASGFYEDYIAIGKPKNHKE